MEKEYKSQWDVEPPVVTTPLQDKLKKFEELKQRRKQVCGKSTAKRVNHIRQQATEAVLSEFYGPDVLQDIGYGARRHGKHSRKRGRRPEELAEDKSGDQSINNVTSEPEEMKWQELKQFLDPNPQLKGTTKEDGHSMSGLEERLEDAITEGNLNKATELSDTLANRKFLTKVAGAFDCKQYLDKVKEDEEWKKSKKQKLHWRFDVKERWETKSNM